MGNGVSSSSAVSSSTPTSTSISLSSSISSTLSSSSSSPTITTISSCPANARTVTYDDGSVYEICPQANFAGTTYNSASGTLSSWDCLQQCNLDQNCIRAAYRDSDFTCQFKSNGTNWVVDSAWSTIRRVKVVPQTKPQNTGLGLWTTVLITPVIPVGAYIVPAYPSASRVLVFSSWSPVDFTTNGPRGVTQFADYNFVNGKTSARTVSETGHDMFCPGMSQLQDGRLMVSGGSNATTVSIYDPTNNAFTRGADMQIGRGYHATTITSAGQVFTIGGSFAGGIGGKNGEIYNSANNSWRLLPGVPVDPILTTDNGGDFRTDNHPWLYGWKNGSVFHAGPSKKQHWFNTNGDGAVVDAGTRDPNNDAMCSVHVMYDAVAGKIFSAGGAQDYTNSDAFTKAFVTTIGDPYTPASVQQVNDLIYPRGLANAVVLPDGTVLITGGQKRSMIFTDTDAWLTPELWDPATQKTTPLAASAIPRTYHSLSLLLSDGRVLVGGGGLCDTPAGQSDANCGRVTDHPDIEVFSPPYLFNVDNTAATRPVISKVSSNSDSSGKTVRVGGKLTVTMTSSAAVKFVLIRMGSVTHSTNTDQRRIPISNVSSSGSTFTLPLPSDAGILTPGYYYVFALNAKGTPSVSMTVRVTL